MSYHSKYYSDGLEFWPSSAHPGFWYCRCHFLESYCYAVVDDFGNLVKVRDVA